MKFSELTFKKAADAYYKFCGDVGRAIGVAVGALLLVAGAIYLMGGATTLCFMVVAWMGWYSLLIPVGIVAVATLTLLVLKYIGFFDKKD